MISKLRTLYRNDLFRHNVVFFIGSISVGIVNYLLYPILSRLLDVSTFGEIQVLINILLQLTIVTNVVSLFVVNITTNQKSIKETRLFIANLESVVLLFSVLVGIIIVMASPLLASRLQYSSIVPFWALALYFVFNVPLSIRVGFLRAKRAFVETSYAQVAQGTLRLILSVIAAALGLGVAGVMFGMAGSLLIATFYVAYLSNKFDLRVKPFVSLTKPSLRSLRKQFATLSTTGRFMVLITAVTFCNIFLLSFDTILAKYFFSPELAGAYSGITVAARIIYFGTGSVAAVLASSVRADDQKQKSVRKLLASVGFAVLGGGVLTGLFIWQPELIIRGVVGGEYVPFISLFTPLVLGTLYQSVINVFLMYHVAVRDRFIGYIAVGCVLIDGVSLLMYHDTPDMLAHAFMNGSMFALALVAIWSVYWHRFARSEVIKE